MKTKTIFVCQECGSQTVRWMGKCPSCGSWNSLVEESITPTADKHRKNIVTREEAPVLLTDILIEDVQRLSTGVEEFDRVLGGGVVPSSVVLIGGDPGIGKSTLALQVGCHLSDKKCKVLYISGEESVKQAKIRADRLSMGEKSALYIVNQVDINVIVEHIKKMQPEVVVIDSIQVIYQPEISSSPGSVSQVRECSSVLTSLAKSLGIALFIIGHVTKEGMLAGPKVLEHIVDTVLYFEGERYSTYRILRTTKNRFGSTNEIGVFEMTHAGLSAVSNPSEIFLSERSQNVSGSAVVPILEGTRPLLVEIQGLVSRSAFGVVRQKTQGFDANRLALLIAVLDKRIGLTLQDKDIFLNVVGGVRVMDPAADLAVALAVASALLDKPVPSDMAILGEIGLSSEVRSVSQVSSRIHEAQRLGFKRCVVPKNNFKVEEGLQDNPDMNIILVGTVKETLELL